MPLKQLESLPSIASKKVPFKTASPTLLLDWTRMR